MDNPFDIVVYDRNMVEQGVVAAPDTATLTRVRNGISTLVLTVPVSASVAPALVANGAHLILRYRGRYEFGGQRTTGESPVLKNGQLTTYWSSVDSMLAKLLGWVQPIPMAGGFLGDSSGAINPTSLNDLAQVFPSAWGVPHYGNSGVYGAWWMVGPNRWGDLADPPTGVGYFVGRLLIDNLVERLRLPIIVANNPAAGGVIARKITPEVNVDSPVGDWVATFEDPAVRFDPLASVVRQFADWADQYGTGLNVAVQLQPGPIPYLVHVDEPPTEVVALTVESGAIADGTWTITAPTSSRVILGGPGEERDRLFYEVRDNTGRESEHAFVAEVFKDATGAGLAWPDTLAEQYRIPRNFLIRSEVPAAAKATVRSYFAQMAAEPLAQGAARTGLSLTLTETENARYGGATGVQLGQKFRVPIAGRPNDPVEARLEQVVLSLTAAGFDVKYTVGTRDDNPNVTLAKIVKALAEASSQQSSRR